MLNHATTALSSYLCDQVENLRARFAQKANRSHFALTALFQASSIRLSRRRARRARTSVSVYVAPTEDSALTSADDFMVFIIYLVYH
jgi:hypothetical protein